jgi:D-ribose pyranose/furanose isomerase RbsD
MARLSSKKDATDLEDSSSIVDPFLQISQDVNLIELSTSLNSPRFMLSDSLLDELRHYSISEEMLNNSFGSSQDVQAITQCLKNVVIFRHRVGQIHTMLIDLHHDLEELNHTVQTYLYRKYSVYRNLKNEVQRNSAVDSALPDFYKVNSRVLKFLEIAKYVDEKLDKNEFTLRAILQSSERLLYSKEGIKHVK